MMTEVSDIVAEKVVDVDPKKSFIPKFNPFRNKYNSSQATESVERKEVVVEAKTNSSARSLLVRGQQKDVQLERVC